MSASPREIEGMVIEDETLGDGAEAVDGKVLTLHYAGKLETGYEFDNTFARNQPIRITLGGGEVIRGWDLGLGGMKVGGKRKLTVPPELGFGANGAGGVIPPNATLTFEIELLEVSDPVYVNVDNAETEKLVADGAVLVDIRTPQEWMQTGVVEGSKLLPFMGGPGPGANMFLASLAKVARKDDPVVLICRTGSRTRAACEFLGAQAGYVKVYNVSHGIMGWMRDGRPVVRASAEMQVE